MITAISKYKKELKNCLVCPIRRPLIHIESCDYEWERRILSELFCDKKVRKYREYSNKYAWSSMMGFHRFRGDETILEKKESTFQDLISGIEYFLNEEKHGNEIMVIENIEMYFDAIQYKEEEAHILSSRLCQFYCQEDKKPAGERAQIIIICPKFDIPSELQGMLHRITSPFPDENDIAYELGLNISRNEFITSVEENSEIRHDSPSNNKITYTFSSSFIEDPRQGVPSWDVFTENKKTLLTSLKGMRISTIQAMLSYNVDPDSQIEEPYKISAINLEMYTDFKKRMVMDSGLLNIESIEPRHEYQNFVGDIDALKEYITEQKKIIDNRANYNKRMSMPKGILLVGPPGCGKSETSKAIADILDLPLLSLDMGKLMNKWVGESEHNFQNAIALAEAAQPCVLRIDELEKAFSGSSGETGDQQDNSKILGFFLTWMQERKSMVYLVATANNLDQLRPEFLRKGRWDEIYYLTYPSADGMLKIFESCFKKYNIGVDNLEELIHGVNTFYSAQQSNGKKVKVSGAEIADTVQRVYKHSFIKNKNEDVTKLKSAEILSRLNLLTSKDENYDVSIKVEKDIRQMHIDALRQYSSFTPEKEKILRESLLQRFSDSNLKDLIDSEVATLRFNLDLERKKSNGNIRDISDSDLREMITRKYSKSYIHSIIEQEVYQYKINSLLHQDLDLDPNVLNKERELIRAKYTIEHDIEERYKAKGYLSASIKVNNNL